MSWGLITNDLRLKLLALVLAVLMLGAVAFSQTKPTSKFVTVGLVYAVQPNIIIINPPSRVTVAVTGLSDAISRVDSSNVIASVDATRVGPSNAARLNVSAKTTVPNVAVQNPPPIVVKVETLQAYDIKVQVVAHAATGWNIDPSKTHVTCPGAANPDPCSVHFTGPVDWGTGLKAVAIVQGQVFGTADYVNQPVQLQTPSGPLDLSVFTAPPVTFDVTSANVHMQAVQGTTSASVPLLSGEWTGPPTGYRVTQIIIDPQKVTITGDPGTLQRVPNIKLPSVDLSGSTTDTTFTLPITYPPGVAGTQSSATIRYLISRAPGVSPSS